MADTILKQLSAEQALERLLSGNRRFSAGASIHPNQDAERRKSLVDSQLPFAVVLACADGRTAPEIVFDQGLGDIFVIRVGGNIVDEIVLESVNFAVAAWGIPLVMVLGHQNCGAIAAAMRGIESGAQPGRLFLALRPAVLAALGAEGDPMPTAVRTNAKHSAAHIAADKHMAELAMRGEVKIVSAYYDMSSGTVTMI